MNRYLIDGITRDLMGGKRIVFVGLPVEADSLHRGFSADVVVVDPDVRRNPELMEAIIPMIAGHGELIVASF